MKILFLLILCLYSYRIQAQSELWKEQLTCHVEGELVPQYILGKVFGPDPLQRELLIADPAGDMQINDISACNIEELELICSWRQHAFTLDISSPRRARRLFSSTYYYAGSRTIGDKTLKMACNIDR